MNNFDTVFTIIKKHCKEVGVENLLCFYEIESALYSNKIFLSSHHYLEVIEALGLIKFFPETKSIVLTNKGKETERLFSNNKPNVV